MRESVVFYRSFAEAIKALPKEEQLKALWAVINYGLDGVIPEEHGVHTAIFLMAKPQIDANNKRYQNGTKGGRPVTKEEPNQNQDVTTPKPNHNQEITKEEPNQNQDKTKAEPKEKDNVKEKVKVKDKDNDNSVVRFTPPTKQDVMDYCQEKGYTDVDVERFMNYYTSNGWMVGKNKMKDWKAAMRNWARKDMAAKPNNTNGNRFCNFEQRNYDYDALEKNLVWKGSG